MPNAEYVPNVHYITLYWTLHYKPITDMTYSNYVAKIREGTTISCKEHKICTKNQHHTSMMSKRVPTLCFRSHPYQGMLKCTYVHCACTYWEDCNYHPSTLYHVFKVKLMPPKWFTHMHIKRGNWNKDVYTPISGNTFAQWQAFSHWSILFRII